MPLMLSAPPEGIEKVLNAAVSELIGHGALATGPQANLVVGAPIRLFHLGADEISAERGLAAAQAVGWIATLWSDDEPLGALELVPVKPARKGTALPARVRFSSFSQGPLQRGLVAAITDAHQSAGRAKIEASVLRAPALCLLALWPRDKGADRHVPIEPAPGPLVAGKPVEADRALALLAELASEVMAGDDTRN